jgi:hypothetical protein
MSNKALIFCILLLATLISIDSCKPKSSDDVSPDSTQIDTTPVSPCIVLSEKINDVLYRSYEYDSMSHLVRMVEYSGSKIANNILKRYTFDYNAGGYLTSFNETNIAVRDQSYIYQVSYAEDSTISVLQQYKVYNSGPRLQDSLSIVYDSNKRISELQSISGSSYSWQYDSLGNAKTWSVRVPSTTRDSVLAQYTAYDTKPNLYTFSKGIQLVDLLRGRVPSRHNPTIYQVGNTKYEVSYEYNTQNVPIKSVAKVKVGTDSLGRETVYSYELQCNKK